MYDEHADVRKTEDEFYRMLSNRDFLPNSPTLMNAGRPLLQLAACVVIPIEDSLESIFESVKHTALIHQSGGGTGFSFRHVGKKMIRCARRAYLLAYREGVKGITIFRSGRKGEQVPTCADPLYC
jgi:ribonucleotide reductase alpha subunit